MTGMRPGRQWTAILGVALAGAAVAVSLLLFRSQSPAPSPAGSDPGLPRLGQAPPHLPVPQDPVDAALTPVTDIMSLWRQAIITKNPDDVLACDTAFLDDPNRYLTALVTSAQTDSEPRVRSFSARVLGKFKDRTLVPVFRKMLLDPDHFVRENAAWALGELREREAAADLRKVARSDPASNVRAAATTALEQMNLGPGRHR